MVSYFVNSPMMPQVSLLVLILIVVDDGLVRFISLMKLIVSLGLNPYCSGRWSRTAVGRFALDYDGDVLILIVVDDGLVPDEIDFIDANNGLS